MHKETNDVQSKLTIECCSIELLAHEIQVGYGGSDLDNWLEAEEILNNKSLSPKNR